MKIALIIKRLNTKGGAQRQILRLAHELQNRGHAVKLYTFLLDKKECFAQLFEGLDVVSLPFYTPPSYGSGGIRGVFSFLGVLRYENNASKNLAFMIDKDTDLLHPHDHVAYRVSIYFKKYRKNIPSVWMMNDMPTRLFSFWRDKECTPGIRLSLPKKIGYWLLDLYEIKKFIRAQDGIAVVDFRDEKWAKEYFGKKADVVRTGLDVEQFPYREHSPPANKKIRLLGTGILLSHRRFEDSIDAIALLRSQEYDASLSIIGGKDADKGYYELLTTQIYVLKLEPYVSFLGRVTESDLLKTYYDNDIFLFPNHLQSWGLAVFEAMATGMPTVVSKSAGASEVLIDGENSLLINPKTPQEIADAVKKLIDNPDLYRTISKNGRRFVEENISWEKYAEQMIDIFQRVMR